MPESQAYSIESQRLRKRRLYNYDLPGFKAEGLLQSPEEIFGSLEGMQQYVDQELAKDRQDAASRTAQETSSEPAGPLTQSQRAMAVGDPIPVVFARRRTGGTGGGVGIATGYRGSVLVIGWHQPDSVLPLCFERWRDRRRTNSRCSQGQC